MIIFSFFSWVPDKVLRSVRLVFLLSGSTFGLCGQPAPVPLGFPSWRMFRLPGLLCPAGLASQGTLSTRLLHRPKSVPWTSKMLGVFNLYPWTDSQALAWIGTSLLHRKRETQALLPGTWVNAVTKKDEHKFLPHSHLGSWLRPETMRSG